MLNRVAGSPFSPYLGCVRSQCCHFHNTSRTMHVQQCIKREATYTLDSHEISVAHLIVSIQVVLGHTNRVNLTRAVPNERPRRLKVWSHFLLICRYSLDIWRRQFDPRAAMWLTKRRYPQSNVPIQTAALSKQDYGRFSSITIGTIQFNLMKQITANGFSLRTSPDAAQETPMESHPTRGRSRTRTGPSSSDAAILSLLRISVRRFDGSIFCSCPCARDI